MQESVSRSAKDAFLYYSGNLYWHSSGGKFRGADHQTRPFQVSKAGNRTDYTVNFKIDATATRIRNICPRRLYSPLSSKAIAIRVNEIGNNGIDNR